MPEVRSTREVAEELGVQEWEIENALRRREVARPPLLGGMRLWDAESVERLREVLTRRCRRRSDAAQGRSPTPQTAAVEPFGTSSKVTA